MTPPIVLTPEDAALILRVFKNGTPSWSSGERVAWVLLRDRLTAHAEQAGGTARAAGETQK